MEREIIEMGKSMMCAFEKVQSYCFCFLTELKITSWRKTLMIFFKNGKIKMINYVA